MTNLQKQNLNYPTFPFSVTSITQLGSLGLKRSTVFNLRLYLQGKGFSFFWSLPTGPRCELWRHFINSVPLLTSYKSNRNPFVIRSTEFWVWSRIILNWFLHSRFYFDLELYFLCMHLYLDRDREKITRHLTLPTQWISKVFLTHGISVRDVFSWLFSEREALQIWLWYRSNKTMEPGKKVIQ